MPVRITSNWDSLSKEQQLKLQKIFAEQLVRDLTQKEKEDKKPIEVVKTARTTKMINGKEYEIAEHFGNDTGAIDKAFENLIRAIVREKWGGF